MIYRVKREQSTELVNIPLCVIEFAYNDNDIIIATDDDCCISLEESAVLLESSFNYPAIPITYNGSNYGVQIIPAKDFIGKHAADRVKFENNGNQVATRRIFFEMPKRGCVSAFKSENKKDRFKDNVNYTKECKYACVGFVYHMIDDIEAFYNSIINFDQIKYLTNIKYNSLPQNQKENLAKIALRNGSE